MSKSWKKLVSLLLAAVMILGPAVSAFAAEPAYQPKALPDRSAFFGAAGEGSGLESLDPDKMNIHRLGELNSDEPEVNSRASLYAADDIVRVSIVLDEPATLENGFDAEGIAANARAVNYRDTLKAEQASIEAAIEEALGSELDVKWNLTLTVNIISANVRYGDISVIKSVRGVKTVVIENRYEPMRDEVNTAITSDSMTGASGAWMNGYTGAGSRIAVIDTGTAQDHISFDPDALEYSYEQNAEKAGLSVEEYKASLNLLDKEEVAGVLDQLNANNEDEWYDLPSADDLYKNIKIPFAYNYVDASTDTDHSGDSQGEHGSHVSGIAAANRYVKKDGGYADAITEVGAVGMAPDAQIITMKVFGLYGGAYDSDYMAAIEDAIILGADVINLSLGSADPGFSFSDTYQSVMDGLEECGAVVSISAGNSYAADSFYEYTYKYADDTSFNTVGSPGSFINSLAVASADNIGEVGRQIVFDGSLHVFFTDSGAEYGKPAFSAFDGTMDYIYIDCSGEAADYEAVNEEISLAGKVVIVNRGDITFSEKGNNLIPYDPAALIVANNQDGSFGMLLDDFTGDFPMCCITLADANAVKAEAKAGTVGDYDVYTGSLELTKDVQAAENTAREDAAASEFSSWGVPDSLILKPEITAPGGSIWSVNGMTDDGYELMSGTSMAAPHIAGLSAVAAQYIRENDVLAAAQEVSGMTELTQRALIQSLLMSTATPMLNDGLYLPVIQVGAGLADIGAATSAKSFILMDDSATVSAADGKVKAELGQDAKREGEYEYSFTVNNLTDENLAYSLSTDLFTQDTDSYYDYYLLYATAEIPADVEYAFDVDVDLDGDLDFDDVQAVLDYVTGLKTAEEIDTAWADFDGDGTVTSLDAELILRLLTECGPVEGDKLSVPANRAVKVTVKITLTDTSPLDREGGAYIEGYTYLTGTKVSEDGGITDAEHSIPILGYYGSWTDSTMFDNGSLVDSNYTGKMSYFGNELTDELIFTLNGKKFRVEGNPYAVEDEFPADRVAVNGNAVLAEAKYTLIRNAADLHAVVMQDGKVLQSKYIASNPDRAFYHVNEESWFCTDAVTDKIGFDLSSLGLSDGDRITAGLLAVPEYYALMLDPQTDTGSISPDGSPDKAAELYAEGEIGKGALLGYEFTLDSEAPDILAAEYSEENNTITVRVKDNLYLAYLAVCDVGGSVIYLEAAPNCSYAEPLEQSAPGEEITHVFDLSEAVDEEGNPVNVGSGAAVFAGDYAGNEKAVLVRLAEGPVPLVTVTDIFVLTDELEDGKEYLILNAGEEGDADALTSLGADYPTETKPVSVQLDEDGIPYVDAVSANSIWQAYENSNEDEEDQAETGISFYNDETGAYLGYAQDYPCVGWSVPDYAELFSYDPETHLMTLVEEPEHGLCFYYGYYWLDEPTEVYLYVRTPVKAEVEIDPEEAYTVTIDPEEVTLFLSDGLDSEQVFAEVSPIVLEDKTVIWSSLDESVAVVDENGVITARGYGETYVIAASGKTPSVTAAVHVTVPEGSPIEQSMYAQITTDGIPQWVLLNGDMTYETILEVEEWELTGGGRSGDWVCGIDTDKYFDRFDPVTGEPYDYYAFSSLMEYAPLDAASIPKSLFRPLVEVGEDEEGEPVYEEREYVIDYGMIGVSQGGNLVLVNLEEGLLDGFSLSSEGNFVAIAFIGCDDKEDKTGYDYYYYALTDEGMMYIFVLTPVYDEEKDDWTFELDPIPYGLIGGSGFIPNEDPTAYSMNYLGFSYTVDENGSYVDLGEEAVVLADRTNGTLWHVNLDYTGEDFLSVRFVGLIEGCTNLVSLYNDDLDSDVSYIEEGEEEEDEDEYAGRTGRIPAFIRDIRPQSAAGPKMKKLKAENIRTGDPAVNRTVGGLSSVTLYESAKKADDAAQGGVRSEEVTFDLVEEEDVTNGYAVVTFDPALLEYVGHSSGLDYTSFNVDAGNGRIRFAYATAEAAEAGEPLATVTFRHFCDDAVVTAVTVERNDGLGLSETSETTEEGLGHVWNGPEWTWTQTGSGFAAATVFTCENDPSHVRTIEADVKKETSGSATVYIAAVTGPDGEEYYSLLDAGLYAGSTPGSSGGIPVIPSYPIISGGFTPAKDPAVPAADPAKTAAPAAVSTLPFVDVSLTDPFYGDVKYVYENDIMNGVSSSEFAPTEYLTRAMVVTILYRVEKEPAVEYKGVFTDVEAGTWYSEAVEWAAANAIVNGYGDGKFGPTDPVTREQLAAILFRYANFKGYDVSVGEDTNILSYDDAFTWGAWAVPALRWAVGADVLGERSYGVLAPAAAAYRYEVAAAVHAFCEKVVPELPLQ